LSDDRPKGLAVSRSDGLGRCIDGLGRLYLVDTFGRLDDGATDSEIEIIETESNDAGLLVAGINPEGSSRPRTECFTARISETNAAIIMMPTIVIIMEEMVMGRRGFCQQRNGKKLVQLCWADRRM
jgi:hypothetical protein